MPPYRSIPKQFPPDNLVVIVLDECIHIEHAGYWEGKKEMRFGGFGFRLWHGFGWFGKWRYCTRNETICIQREMVGLEEELEAKIEKEI